MQKIKQAMIPAVMLALAGLTMTALAQWPRSDGRNDRQIGQLLSRIEQRAARFQNSAEQSVNQSRLDNTQKEVRLSRLMADFQEALAQLRNRYNRRQATDADVRLLLDRADGIDGFVYRHQLSAPAESDWRTLRGDLDSLASAYNLAWNWGRDGGRETTAATRLSGTFRLNPSQSDDARLIVERAVRDLPYNDRQRVSERLLRRLDAPEQLAIERQGRMITMASSLAPQAAFEADGQEHVEQYPNSQRVSRVTASLAGDQLIIDSTGNRDTDYRVTFDPINNGRQLRVTRRFDSDRLTQPVVVESLYDQVSNTARWDVYSGTQGFPNDRYRDDRYGNNRSADDFIVPDGALIVSRLNDNLDTSRTRAGDRFTLTVISPREYAGATIAGQVVDANRSGRVTGRAELALSFDSIQLRNGRTARFAGTLDSVRAANGESLRVDTEGTVQDSSQTGRTVTRTAIGSVVGAVIGAVAGGGKGAAVGAAAGGGVGAGSVFVQGRNDLQLTSGTEITIRASAPRRDTR